MRTVLSPVRRRVRAGVIATAVALALMIPAVALAANTATFSSRTPSPGSSSTNKRPTVSVAVYDKYGAHGSGAVTLKIDNATVSPSVGYTVIGNFNPNKPDYRRIKVAYRPSADLKVGKHTITLRIKDLKRKVSTMTWTFSVVLPYHASFSAPAPANGSSTMVSTPTISVSVNDTYGVKGASSYSMTLNGAPITPSIKYTTSGDYRRLTFTYHPAALAVNDYVVVCGVTDLKGNHTDYTWNFSVIPYVAPPLPEMPVTIASSACATCHTGYPAAHPMTQCPLCHGDGTPLGGFPETVANESAHTPGCAAETPCHGGGGNFPHVLGTDCSRCHNGSFTGIPAGHGDAQTGAAHVSTSAFCTQSGCHNASLTVEHYNHTVGGVRLSCGTCHGSTDASVTAAIASGSTACEDCHDLGGTQHIGTTAVHSSTETSCTQPGCHAGSDVAAIHKGACADCHANPDGHAASVICTDCHSARIHTTVPGSHTAARIDCTAGACHGTNAMAIHQSRGPLWCQTCHAPDATKTLVCATCHSTVPATAHAPGDVKHAISGDCAIPGCHVDTLPGAADVSVIHATAVTPGVPAIGCRACHVSDAVPPATIVCATCHTPNTYHAGVDAGHSLPAKYAGCVVSGCHSSADVSVIHQERGFGCVTCHANGSVPRSTECSDCHDNVPHTDVTDAHVGPENGCDRSPECHSRILPVTHNGNCGLCHTGGVTPPSNCETCHSVANAPHLQESADHTAHNSCTTGAGCHDGANVEVLHNNKCSDCHANPDGHPASLVCTTCHSAHDLPALHAATMTSATFVLDGTSYGSIACSTCHASSDLRTLHGGDNGCSNCHPNPAHAVLGTWDHTCTQGGCHNSESTMTVAYHGATVNGAHDTTPGVTASCGARACHGDVSNAAAIHASHGGCADCHANPDGHAASLVCSTCHVPHDLDAIHAATLTSTDITIHGTDYGTFACTACHEANLLTPHERRCAACHSVPVDTTLGGTWNKGCVQGDCHGGASPLTYHSSSGAGLDSAHDTSAGVPANCGGSGCHGTVTDAAAIHASHGGCADCHANPDGHPASLVCSTCHAPHDLPSAHAATMTTTSILIGGTIYGPMACSSCHTSTDLRDIHGGNCAACHTTSVDTTLGGAWDHTTCTQGGCHAAGGPNPYHNIGGPAVESAHETTPGVTTRCAGAHCHGDVTDAAAIHASHGGCADCHANPDGHAASLVCSTCHAPHNLPSAHAATLTSATMTINGTDYGPVACSMCHASSDLRPIHSNDCAGCHTTPVDTTLGATWDKSCVQGGCHGLSSANPYHATISPAHDTSSGVPANCGGSSCHGTVTDAAAIHSSHGGCADCHANPDGHAASLVCSTCHAPHDLTAVHTSALSSTDITITVNGADYGFGCSDCHASGDLRDVHASNCAGCHTTPVDTTLGGTWDKSCAQGGCHSSGPLVFHGSNGVGIESAHETSPGLPANCGGSDCHGDVTDAAAIHVGHGGCLDCHANPDGHAASLVCSTCHAPHDLDAVHGATLTSTDMTVHGVDYGTFDCSTCHARSTDLRSIHSNNCAACHATAVDTTLGGTWNKSCVQGGCHSSGPLAFHSSSGAKVDSAHDTSPGVPANCGGAGCHGTVTDAAAIHAAHGGCVDCHANPQGHPASLVCSTCHAPHDLAADHAATVTSADITIHGTDYGSFSCSACHASADLRTIHGGDSSCVNCHPNPAALIMGTWDKTCTQGGCHNSESTMTVSVHANVDSAHETSPGVTITCGGAGCHNDVTDAEAIHASHGGCADCHANPDGHAASLICSTCHSAHNLPALHAATMTSASFTVDGTSYGSIACSTCHASSDLRTLHGGDTGCTNCHPNPARAILGTWDHTCTQGGCHNSESTMTVNYHGATVNGSHTTTPGVTASCGSAGCHGDVTNAAAIHASHGGCVDCHANPDGHAASLVCSTCHTPHDLTSLHAAALTSVDFTIHGTDYGVTMCLTCHPVPDLRTIHSNNCAACHTTKVDTTLGGTWNKTCVQGGCHASGAGALAYHRGTGTKVDSAHDTSAGVTTSCGGIGCHGTVTDATAIHAAHGGCADCHANPDGHPASLICSSCHTLHDLPTLHAATMTSVDITIKGVDYGSHSCSDCHASSDLRTLHGGDTGCANCHPNPAAAILGSWNKTCTQGGCHNSESTMTVGQHASLDASHTLASIPTSCVTAGCHTAGASGKDVAALHAVAGGPGCICHAAGKTLTLTCTASGCHPTGAPANHSSGHTAADASATITINSVPYTGQSCSNCHGVLDMQAIHGGTSGCANCHPAPRSTFTTWDGTCSQGGCHSSESTMTVVQHATATLNSAHTLGSVPTACVAAGCHTAGASGKDVAALHAVAGGPGCICHAAGKTVTLDCTHAGCHTTYPSVPVSHASHVATVGPTVSVSINGTPYGSYSCTTCHASLDLQHVTQHANCATCHPTPAGTAPKGYFACNQTGCHADTGTHQGTAVAQHAPATLNSAHTVTLQTCNASGCHTGAYNGSSDVAAIHNVANANKCVTCHNTSGNTVSTCNTPNCHSSGSTYPMAAYSSASSVVAHPGEVAKHNTTADSQCNNCHGTGGSNWCHPGWGGDCEPGGFSSDLPLIHASHGGCAACHEPGVTLTDDGSVCQKSGCHAVSDMQYYYDNQMD